MLAGRHGDPVAQPASESSIVVAILIEAGASPCVSVITANATQAISTNGFALMITFPFSDLSRGKHPVDSNPDNRSRSSLHLALAFRSPLDRRTPVPDKENKYFPKFFLKGGNAGIFERFPNLIGGRMQQLEWAWGSRFPHGTVAMSEGSGSTPPSPTASCPRGSHAPPPASPPSSPVASRSLPIRPPSHAHSFVTIPDRPAMPHTPLPTP